MSKSPTDRQIAFAERIADVLDIDFPAGSPDFTQWTYYQFINAYIDEYKYVCAERAIDEYAEDDMAWWDPFAEGGY